MANIKRIPLSIILFILAALKISHAIEYTVTNKVENTPGGIRFNNEIGVDYTKLIMDLSTNFVWETFQQNSPAEKKTIEKVSVFIETTDGVGYTINDEIHVSATYIQGYSDNVKTEITGVLYHMMTHVWQWNRNEQANGGLIEGIADYVRLKAGYA
ncbi:basic secretory protein-like protein, partial [Salmonella sp. s57610]|uniref:basic secretory protein-like protein n=1 Tax=Salmonella sp. s57610 TaxID=3159697 RepID=UPI00397F8C02